MEQTERFRDESGSCPVRPPRTDFVPDMPIIAVAATAGRRYKTMVRTILISVLVLTLVGAANVRSAPASAAEGDLPTLTGLTSPDRAGDLDRLDAVAGRYPSFSQVFWTVEGPWPNGSVTRLLDSLDERGVTGIAEITVDDLKALNSGKLDGSLEAMAATIVRWLSQDSGRRILIAPLPEPNLVQHAWGADPDGFKAGYKRIRSAFIDAGASPAQARFVVSYSGWSNGGLLHEDFYPGDGVVDLVGFSQLNRNDPWLTYEKNFGWPIDQISAFAWTEPILVIQTGSVVEGRDRDAWMGEAFSRLAADDRVLGMVYFNRNKYEADKWNDYRVVYPDHVDGAFLAGMKSWASGDDDSWLFDGGLDRWADARRAEVAASGGFIDVGNSVFATDIAWLASVGVTSGCNPPANDRFCPESSVTRGQMAAFLRRAIDLPVVADPPGFTDVGDSVFATDIAWLASVGVTSGCNPPANDRFCPESSVTRGQMAAFLRRAIDLPVVADPGGFTDLGGSVFASDIAWLASVGVTSGCNPPANDRFCPDGVVTRGQMAAFLRRALDG